MRFWLGCAWATRNISQLATFHWDIGNTTLILSAGVLLTKANYNFDVYSLNVLLHLRKYRTSKIIEHSNLAARACLFFCVLQPFWPSKETIFYSLRAHLPRPQEFILPDNKDLVGSRQQDVLAAVVYHMCFPQQQQNPAFNDKLRWRLRSSEYSLCNSPGTVQIKWERR